MTVKRFFLILRYLDLPIIYLPIHHLGKRHMIFLRKFFSLLSVIFFSALFSLINLSCSQYDYSSPLPGIVEVRLKTISKNIPFDPLNNFVINVSRVVAVREDGAKADIYEDLKAIQRNKDGNNYNTLDFRARDSALIIGQTYLPPGKYVGINMVIKASTSVVQDGYRIIFVEIPDEFQTGITLNFRSNYEIRELVTTKIKLAIDLDSTLVKRANSYRLSPYYYISAIE